MANCKNFFSYCVADAHIFIGGQVSYLFTQCNPVFQILPKGVVIHSVLVPKKSMFFLKIAFKQLHKYCVTERVATYVIVSYQHTKSFKESNLIAIVMVCVTEEMD